MWLVHLRSWTFFFNLILTNFNLNSHIQLWEKTVQGLWVAESDKSLILGFVSRHEIEPWVGLSTEFPYPSPSAPSCLSLIINKSFRKKKKDEKEDSAVLNESVHVWSRKNIPVPLKTKIISWEASNNVKKKKTLSQITVWDVYASFKHQCQRGKLAGETQPGTVHHL